MKSGGTRRRFRVASLLALIALCGMLAVPAMAQTTTGSIYGTVADETGAVIPNAPVVVKNIHTGETHTANSNDSGNYTFPAIEPGDYSVSTRVSGFQAMEQTHIHLSASQSVHVSFELHAGAENQTVTVNAETTLVDTRESQMGETIDQRRIEDLPLNGRNAYDLVQIIPGVTNYKPAAAGGDSAGTTFQVNGNRSYGNSFYLDGVFDTTIYRNGGSQMPNPDALQEFRILTSNFDAEFGREPGGVVNAITRSGTNAYHGTVFEYLRNNVLNAKNYFQSSVTPLKQNQFGASFGGPIVHNKLFFFGSYQALRLRTPSTITSSSLITPTPAEAMGDFTMSPVSRQPKSPAVSCNGVANKICPALLDPVAQNLLKYVPLADPVTRLTPQQSAPANGDGNEYLGRVDDQLTASHKVSGLFYTSRTRTKIPAPGQNKVLDFTQAASYENQTNTSLSDSWIVSPTAVNNLRLFYVLNHYQINSVFDSTWSDYGSQVGSAGPLARQPLITIAGYWAMGLGGQGPQNLSMQQVGASDTFNWLSGNHSLKLGGSMIWHKYAETGVFLQSGKVAFTGNGANALVNFLEGKATQLEQNTGAFHRFHAYIPAVFAQDDWKISRKLSLNLGLRWELYPPYKGQNNRGTFVPNVQSIRFPTAPLGLLTSGDPGIPDGIRHTTWKTFAPRVGFAYDVLGNGSLSLRGAYGLFYSASGETMEGNLVQQPFQLDVKVNNTPNLVTPYAPGPDPFPYDVSHPVFTSGASLTGMPPNDNNVPSVQEYNLTLQKQFGENWGAQIAYVGSVSHEFYLLRDQNSPVFKPGASTSTAGLNARRPYQPTPSTYEFGTITLLDPSANASYNALQVTATRRFANGFSLLASYVWSRDLQTVSADPSNSLNLVNENDISMDYGLSDFAVPRRFVASYLWSLPGVHHWGLLGKEVLSGWQINGITTLQSGTPFTITSGKDTNLDGTNTDRPDQVGNPNLPSGRSRAQKIAKFFNTSAFAQVPAGTPYGNVRRASMLGPGTVNTDISAFKTFPVFRESTVQFRGEVFNVFNNVNLTNPNGVLTNAKFGVITGSGSPRIVQFALRYSF